MIEDSQEEATIKNFVRRTIAAFGVSVVTVRSEGDIYRLLDPFEQQTLDVFDSKVEERGVTFYKYAYRYENYNLHIFYLKNMLLFFILDGNVGGYSVVRECVWYQNIRIT